MPRHKNATKVARAIDKTFRALRTADEPFFAESDFWCCQSCGCAGVPSDRPRYAFYHEQDKENLNRTGRCNIAWGDTPEHGERIAQAMRDNGLSVEWDGTESKRITVFLPED